MRSKTINEQRVEYTDLGSDLGEKDKHVSCDASALTLTITDKACQEAET